MQLLLTWATLVGGQDEQQVRFIYLMMVSDSPKPVCVHKPGLSLAYQRGVYSCQDVLQASLILIVASIVWTNPSYSDGFSLTRALICPKTQSTEATLCRMRPKRTRTDCWVMAAQHGRFIEASLHLSTGFGRIPYSWDLFLAGNAGRSRGLGGWGSMLELHMPLVNGYVSLFH